MKPRRDNGATFVSPTTSEVRMGWAVTAGFLRLMGIRIQQALPVERKSPACEDRAGTGARRGKATAQKTRPSAQYDANGLASPGH
jgi:hypothetical protein